MSQALVCAKIESLQLPSKTIIKIDSYIITNDPEEVINNEQQADLVKLCFGIQLLSSIKQGNTYLFFKTNDDVSNFHLNAHFFANILDELWQIKDNSVFISSFSFVPISEKIPTALLTMNYFNYNSEGKIENTMFSESELQSLPVLRSNIESFFSNSDVEKGKQPDDRVFLSHLIKEYNDKTRIERAYSFKMNARKESSLPIKITNYIAFLECLFSISEFNIKENISTSTAKFLKKYHMKDLHQSKNLVKKCYKIRSSYIHGNTLKGIKVYNDLKAVSLEIDNMCRLIVNTIINNNLEIFNNPAQIKSYIRQL